uniref:Uncharacterized protein n=1 Tax=Noctiluca scintillans TaxID=2966 RepID=A0A7S1F221_NOCSC|mmetsp:Transcript_25943/g.68030  ORF Transcript_25943/g.68030 Transcript_25943/m.68030 type:complete len:368 (+) Transcript_25943:62-1165(+)
MRFHEQSLLSSHIVSEDLQTYLKGILPVLVNDSLLSVNPHAQVDHSTGASRFLASLATHDIIVFFILCACLAVACGYADNLRHGQRLLLFIVAGFAYGAVCLGHHGARVGSVWLNGYIVEMIFSLENVCIFHIVTRAFKCPRQLQLKAISIVIVVQVLFQLLLYVGFARFLVKVNFLSYALGVWLILVGLNLVCSGAEVFDIKESRLFSAFSWLMGNRLLPEFRVNGEAVVSDQGFLRLTLFAPFVACLIFMDLLLELDVTMTKLEIFDYSLLNFTSSAVAAFAVPDLFFVAEGVFERSEFMNYGIAFAMIFYGVVMLVQDTFRPSPFLCLGVVTIAMLTCFIVSTVLSWNGKSREDEITAHSESGQ